MAVYYVTFIWDRKLWYDGYILRKENGKLIGATDEKIIYGDKITIYEHGEEGINKFRVPEEIFLLCNMNKKVELRQVISQYNVKLYIEPVYDKSEEETLKRIKTTMAYFPYNLQAKLLENYQAED